MTKDNAKTKRGIGGHKIFKSSRFKVTRLGSRKRGWNGKEKRTDKTGNRKIGEVPPAQRMVPHSPD
jgi:hypothetical protein